MVPVGLECSDVRTAEIPASRQKLVFLLLVSAALFLLSIALVPGGIAYEPSARFPDWMRWLSVVMWSLCCIIFIWQFAKPSRIVLDSEGFTWFGGFRRPQKVLWRDVDEFFVWQPALGAKAIAYRLRPEARLRTRSAWLGRKLGVDGSLPDTWRIPANDVAAKLNAFRQINGAGATQQEKSNSTSN